jgi:hypothetical protein
MGWDRHSLARKECDAKAARAAALPAPSKQAIRSKLRAHEGMAALKRNRPQTADTTLGLTDTEDMMRLRAASVAARLRPKSADGGQTATKSSAARALLTDSSDSVRYQRLPCLSAFHELVAATRSHLQEPSLTPRCAPVPGPAERFHPYQSWLPSR